MKPNQEPKYEIKGKCIVNRSSGRAIPDDEPIFILRARDAKAVPLLEQYLKLVSDCDPKHIEAVSRRLTQFEKFATDHPDRMKLPDTVLTKDWDALV